MKLRIKLDMVVEFDSDSDVIPEWAASSVSVYQAGVQALMDAEQTTEKEIYFHPGAKINVARLDRGPSKPKTKAAKAAV